MSLGGQLGKDYEWQVPIPPAEFLARLERLIREEKRICGEIHSASFRVRLGRTPVGFQRSTYEGTVEASGQGSIIRASAVPPFRIPWNGIEFKALGGIGILLIVSGVGYYFISGSGKDSVLIVGVGAGWLVLTVLLSLGRRAMYWLDAEQIQAYLVERFREPVVVRRRSG
jgi:hypothetical protein